MSAPARLIPRWFSVAVVVLLIAVAGASCRRPAGTCELDVDCQAGFDCRARRCTRRAPLPAAPSALGNRNVTDSSPGPAGSRSSSTEALPPALAPTPARLVEPPAPAVPSPEPATPPPSAPRLPAWKVRLQNT